MSDLVEVVRCKDCKYSHTVTDPLAGHTFRVCMYGINDCRVKDTHYCGYGDRRGDASE